MIEDENLHFQILNKELIPCCLHFFVFLNAYCVFCEL